jgi:hypothetical protein
MKLVVFVGKATKGESWLYEDDGRTTEYMSGRTANTSLSFLLDMDTYPPPSVPASHHPHLLLCAGVFWT